MTMEVSDLSQKIKNASNLQLAMTIKILMMHPPIKESLIIMIEILEEFQRRGEDVSDRIDLCRKYLDGIKSVSDQFQ
jgi:hypothetical protein